MKLSNSKKVFVTGGTGLIGTHLLSLLLENDYSPIVLYRKQSNLLKVKHILSYYHKNATELFSKIEWIEGNINDISTFKNSISRAEYVFHCAGKISSSRKHLNELQKTNVLGTKNIALACHQTTKKLCYISSISVFKKREKGIKITEKSPNICSDKKSPYSSSKYAAEQEVLKLIDKGLDAVIVNPSVVVGPGSWQDGFGKLISNYNKGMPFFTSGATGFVDVRDVAKIMLQLMENNVYGKRFVVSSENYTFKDVLDLISINLQKRKPFISLPKSILKIIAATNISNSITFETTNAAFNKSYYQNKEIKKTLNYSFIPVKHSIEESCKLFLKDKAEK